MDLKTIAIIVLRRWYLSVPIAIAAIVFAFTSGGAPSYTVDASFLLLSPNAAEVTGDRNPLLETQSGVNSVADLAVVVMHGQQRRGELGDAGYSPGYAFSVARSDPFVTLEVSDDDPDLAIESSTVLAQLFTAELSRQQLRFGANSGALVEAELLEISEAEADYSFVRVKQMAILAAGLLLAFGAAFGVEGLLYFFGPRREEFNLLLAEHDEQARTSGRYTVGAATNGNGATPDAVVQATDDAPSPRPPVRSRWSRSSGDGA